MIALNRFALAAAAVAAALVVVPLAPAQAAVKVERVVSKGGITAWLVQDRLNPIISMKVLVRGAGSSLDPKGKEGLAEYAAALYDEGAGKLDSQAFQRKLEDMSISFSVSAGMDDLSISLRTLSRNRDAAFHLVKLALTEPRFDKEPMTRVRSQLLSSLIRRLSSPSYVAQRTWWKSAFPGHPYGRPRAGTQETVKAITRADLVAYTKERIARDRLIIGVTGDITPAELKRLLDDTFGALPKKAAAGSVPDMKAQTKGTVTVVRENFPQSVVIFGQPGPKWTDRDFYATAVMNQILGGSTFNSRLGTEVRIKRGLAYSVGSYLNPLDRAGLIMGSVATENKSVKESIEQIRAQWTRMAKKGATAKELEEAKRYMTGSYPLQFASSQRIASMLAYVQKAGYGIDHFEKRNARIEAVTIDDVRRVAKRFLDTSHLHFVVVGNPVGLAQKKG
jgi:zinc protease